MSAKLIAPTLQLPSRAPEPLFSGSQTSASRDITQ